MGRPRKARLPAGIHERKNREGRALGYWLDFRDQHGTRRKVHGGTTMTAAEARMREIRGQVADGSYVHRSSSAARTLEAYGAEWIALRRAEGKRTADREAQLLRDYVYPRLGKRALRDIRPPDVAAFVLSLRAVIGSPKSVINVHGVLSGLLARALFEGHVDSNAAKGLPRGTLPRNVKTRDVGAWTRDEAETLISDERIPEDRRIAYAIALFTGARIGEIAGLRWADLDMRAEPLWRWALKTQYDGQPLKTGRPRDIPVHPELQRLLAAWKLEGWSRHVCRHPAAHDLVVPRHDGTTHSKESLGAKGVTRHAAIVGIDRTGRDFHSFRRTMITCARVDRVERDVLERITHNSAGTVLDQYTYFGWPELCAELGKIKLSVRRGAAVVRIASGARGPTSGPTNNAEAVTMRDDSTKIVEAPGVEAGAERGVSRIRAVNGRFSVPGGERESRQKPRESVPIPKTVPRGTVKAAKSAAARLRSLGQFEEARAIDRLLAEVSR